MTLLPLLLFHTFAAPSLAVRFQQRSSVAPAPYQFTPSEYWYDLVSIQFLERFADDGSRNGIDGAWSSFTIQFGTPPQIVQVLPSTAVENVWVVGAQGCEFENSSAACNSSRGGLTDYGASTTWKYTGIFNLYDDHFLWNNPNAWFGYDTIGLNFPDNNGPVLKNATVASFVWPPFTPYPTDYWLGVFGLNPKPTNYSNYTDESTSYMTWLYEDGLIPSLSCGYTAGAKYRKLFRFPFHFAE